MSQEIENKLRIRRANLVHRLVHGDHRNNLHFIFEHKLFQSLLSMGKTRHSHQESSSSGGSDTVLGSEASISDWVKLPSEVLQ